MEEDIRLKSFGEWRVAVAKTSGVPDPKLQLKKLKERKRFDRRETAFLQWGGELLGLPDNLFFEAMLVWAKLFVLK